MNRYALIGFALILALVASVAPAATTTIVATPSQVPDETPPRVNVGDFPTGYDIDSWQGPATGKSNWHARFVADGDFLSDLFPADAATLTVNDIARISYFTNRPGSTPASRDWWIQLYTRNATPGVKGAGECATWYGNRFINNYNDHTDTSGTWVQYSTDTGMTFNHNCSASAPAPSNATEHDLASLATDFDGALIEMFSVQTDSGWNGYDGYIDGLEIELTNGEIGRVNFEAETPVPVASVWWIAGISMLFLGVLTWIARRRFSTSVA